VIIGQFEFLLANQEVVFDCPSASEKGEEKLLLKAANEKK